MHMEYWGNEPFMSLSMIFMLLRIIGPVVDLQVRGFSFLNSIKRVSA